MNRLSTALAALCLVAGVWRPVAATAHGVGSRDLDPGAARAMAFLYADGEPMAFAQIQVTAPDGTVYQSARADGRGGFAFLPSGPGVWRVAAGDGQGHRAEREVVVAPSGGAAAGPSESAGFSGRNGASAPGPGWRETALGLSLLANLALGAAVLRGRNRGR